MEVWKIEFLQNEHSTILGDFKNPEFEAKNSADALNKAKKWAKAHALKYGLHYKIKRIAKDQYLANSEANNEVRRIAREQ